MTEQKAIYYGQVELIPGVICDGYVLDDNTAVMSERGTADLLGVDQKHLNHVRTNWPPKVLSPFIDKGLSVRTNSVEVAAKNSPHKGRNIIVYDSTIIENLIRAYSLALASHSLKENQRHIGDRCVTLMCSLIRTALDTAIKQACGISADIQQTAQKYYIDAVSLMKEFGFNCSVEKNIAVKKDITKFLDIPESTLNSFLRKHKEEIRPVRLDSANIRSLGSKASRMNGYHLDDVAKIAMGMDTVVGIGLKKRVFGQIGGFAKPDTSSEIQWREVLSKIFDGFDLRFNYPVGKYKVDFFVAKLMLVLECNGYCHLYYDPVKEAERDKFISRRYGMVRFDHRISLETLFNGILQAKTGTVIRLYDFKQVDKTVPSDIKRLTI